MQVLPLDPAANATPAALGAFLHQCREAARRDGRAKLASITLKVGALDPLAVLESIYEPGELHFYVERPSLQTAVSGAEAVLSHTASGPGRFSEVQTVVDRWVADTLAVGDATAPFGGPHFFVSFAFAPDGEAGDLFPAARVFVPRWQVARRGETTTAVANLLVAPDADLAALGEKIWRAHAKFRGFQYAGEVELTPAAPPRFTVSDAPGYPEAVSRALGHIEAGEFHKIVLARTREVVSDQPLHPLRMLNALRQRFPDCFAFSVGSGAGASFIGASPERLLRVADGRLETEALAGSAPRGRSASEDAAFAGGLLDNEKERREHRHVLDSIRRRLAPLGVAVEFPEIPSVKRLANVQHLHTPVSAKLPTGVRLLDVLAELHPTPAVGGTPREPAVARIRELEGFPRGLYAGALGWMNAAGDGEFFVGLRSALVEGSRARLYAGAGIVAGSSPQKELAETELKFRAMQDAVLG